MSNSFSKRIGLTPTSVPAQMDGLNQATRADLFNLYYQLIHEVVLMNIPKKFDHEDPYILLYQDLWADYLKRTLDTYPKNHNHIRDTLKYLIMEGEWYRSFEIFEFFLDFMSTKGNKQLFDVRLIRHVINHITIDNNVGYRLLGNEFVPITNQTELQEIETLSANSTHNRLGQVEIHLASAIRLMSLRPTPDLRNSIKESISMVGSVARLIEPSNDLSRSLSQLEAKGLISDKLSKKLKLIYNYTSDAHGIRHELMDDPKLSLAEARYFLVTCSAFTNYLIDIGVANNLFPLHS